MSVFFNAPPLQTCTNTPVDENWVWSLQISCSSPKTSIVVVKVTLGVGDLQHPCDPY